MIIREGKHPILLRMVLGELRPGVRPKLAPGSCFNVVANDVVTTPESRLVGFEQWGSISLWVAALVPDIACCVFVGKKTSSTSQNILAFYLG